MSLVDGLLVLLLVHHQLRFMEVVLHGSKLMVDILLLQQLRLMEHYGYGDKVLGDN